ncbi:MAG: flagellar export protein FliJ [Pyrinomonadaceae bacterium]|nr:flagellar export protein FliJ [Pyrinomonadaceae bacterium]
MKKFKFNLQTVHDVREIHKEKEQLALAELQTEAKIISERIVQFENMRASAIDNYKRKMKAGDTISVFELELITDHIADLDRQRMQAREELVEKNQECAEQQKKLAAAYREAKVTDRLRENQKASHQLELTRKEQNSLDEIVIAKHARQMTRAK